MSDTLALHHKIELLAIIYSNVATSSTSPETIQAHYEKVVKLVEKED